MPRDEYYEMKELAKQKARESDQQMREGKVGRTPERVVADLQSDALSLIRARPEYKATFDKTLDGYKKGTINKLPLDSRRRPSMDGNWVAGVGPTSDQRRSLSSPESNTEDLYAKVVGDLIGKRYRDSDTYTGWKPNEQGRPEGVGAVWNTQSLAETMGSALPFLSGNTPDVWAKNADPRAVRELAALEAYFAATKAQPGPGMMSPESRMDYATPQLKMLQPQKK